MGNSTSNKLTRLMAGVFCCPGSVRGLCQTRCSICGNENAAVKYFLWVKTLPCEACKERMDLFTGYLSISCIIICYNGKGGIQVSAKSIIKTVVGIIAVIIGLWALNTWHHMLWSSGGPDAHRSQILYMLPYFVASAIATSGLLAIWQGTRPSKRRR